MQHCGEDLLPGGWRWQPQLPACCPHAQPGHPAIMLRSYRRLIWLLLSEGSFPQLQKDKPVQGHSRGPQPRQMGLTGDRRHLIKCSSTVLVWGQSLRKALWTAAWSGQGQPGVSGIGCAPGTLWHQHLWPLLWGPRGVTQGTALATPRGCAEEAKFCRTTMGGKRPSLDREDVGYSWKSLLPLKPGLVREWQQMEGVRPSRLLPSAVNY